MTIKIFTPLLIVIGIMILSSNKVFGETSSWSQCPDGNKIVRCETYDCPRGDTNRDGACTEADDSAKLADARNDSLCSNPISGCGEVLYFKINTTTACAVRVKESGKNCNLYNASNPNFTSPTPTFTPKPTSTPTPKPTTSPSEVATSSASKGGLPATGPSIFELIFLISLSFLGIYLYERFKLT